MDGKNKLYFGDNLKILREYVPDASVDLIYLDPPFNSSATYNGALCSAALQVGTERCPPKGGRDAERRGIRRADHGVFCSADRRLPRWAGIGGFRRHGDRTAITDRRYSKESEAVYSEIVERGPRKFADLMQALLAFLGRNDMMAYLVMMAMRSAPGGRTWSGGSARVQPARRARAPGRSRVRMRYLNVCAPPME